MSSSSNSKGKEVVGSSSKSKGKEVAEPDLESLVNKLTLESSIQDDLDVKKVTLQASDGQEFQVSEAAASLSETIKEAVEDEGCTGAIPLPEITGPILSKVLVYCKMHVRTAAKEEEERQRKAAGYRRWDDFTDEEKAMQQWDSEYIDVDMDTMFHLLNAANYLNCKGLLDLAARHVADLVKGKTVEEMRALFNIQSGFTPEQEAEIRQETPWAFEELEQVEQ